MMLASALRAKAGAAAVAEGRATTGAATAASLHRQRRRSALGHAGASGRAERLGAPRASSEQASDVRTDWVQKVLEIPGKPRGCHVITQDLVAQIPELQKFRVGLAHFFVMHTSCSLTINENASPDVPLDLNDALDAIAPEGTHYRHLDEGPDDMPAHVKSTLCGASLSVPISQGRLLLGIWQGIYLNGQSRQAPQWGVSALPFTPSSHHTHTHTHTPFALFSERLRRLRMLTSGLFPPPSQSTETTAERAGSQSRSLA